MIRVRAARAYHTGAGVWGHKPATEANLAGEVIVVVIPLSSRKSRLIWSLLSLACSSWF